MNINTNKKIIKVVMLVLFVGSILSNFAFKDINPDNPIFHVPSILMALLLIIAISYVIFLIARKFTKVVVKSDIRLMQEVNKEIRQEDNKILSKNKIDKIDLSEQKDQSYNRDHINDKSEDMSDQGEIDPLDNNEYQNF